MKSHALVIGVDEYWTERACLNGAVNDAVDMRGWLRTAGVADANLRLLLSPRKGRKPRGLAYEPATRANILAAVQELVDPGEGDRLWFFFAGHGLTARIANRDESVIAASDFSLEQPENSIALRSIWELFETTRFADQFFFVDACRDMPPDAAGELRVGDWTVARRRSPGQAPVQQFILYATSPGLRARELEHEDGRERGAFTSTLLAGLRGDRRAKVWAPERRAYEIRWDRLVENVRQDFAHRKLGGVLGDDGKPLYQIPQDAGSRGVAGRERDPVLATVRSRDVRPEKLVVRLQPDAIVKTARIHVLDESGKTVRAWTIDKGEEIAFRLLPRTYGLRAGAPGRRTRFARPPVDLYGEPDGSPRECSLKLLVGEGDPVAGEPGRRGSLTVRCDDPLTAIEVLDSSGGVIAVAYGRLNLPAQPAGFYRARLRLPKGTSAETLVELQAGEAEELSLVADRPPREVAELASALGTAVTSQNLVAVSHAVGPMASAHVSTVLALAGGRSLAGGGGDDPVAALGFPSVSARVREPADALLVLVGADSPERLAGVSVRLWRADEPAAARTHRLVPSTAAPWVGRAVLKAPPGAWWLSLEPNDGEPMVLALTSLPGHATMIVAQAEKTRFRLYQFLPRVDGDPGLRERQLRRLELTQRLLLGSGIAAAALLARDLVSAPTLDPLGATLGAYVLLRLGLARELTEPSERLAAGFGDLSDAHVIRGEVVAATGSRRSARQHFARATEAGVPIFGEGLARLREASEVYRLDRERLKAVHRVFEGHMSGSMWSVWLPPGVGPGERLVS